MSKYTEHFKHKVVQEYLSGGGGYKALSQRHGIANRSSIERWVMAYRLHGEAGLSKKKRRRYDADFKLSVLQHMWENRFSITQTAAQFDIRRHSTVGDWERAYREGGVEALTPAPTRRVKKIPIPTTTPAVPAGADTRSREELLAELAHLRMEVAYLKKLDALVQARQKSAVPKKRK
jgi:transposase